MVDLALIPVKLPTTPTIAETIAEADWVVGFSFFVVESSSPVQAEWHGDNMVNDSEIGIQIGGKGNLWFDHHQILRGTSHIRRRNCTGDERAVRF